MQSRLCMFYLSATRRLKLKVAVYHMAFYRTYFTWPTRAATVRLAVWPRLQRRRRFSVVGVPACLSWCSPDWPSPTCPSQLRCRLPQNGHAWGRVNTKWRERHDDDPQWTCQQGGQAAKAAAAIAFLHSWPGQATHYSPFVVFPLCGAEGAGLGASWAGGRLGWRSAVVLLARARVPWAAASSICITTIQIRSISMQHRHTNRS